jgi:hypothetical protein
MLQFDQISTSLVFYFVNLKQYMLSKATPLLACLQDHFKHLKTLSSINFHYLISQASASKMVCFLKFHSPHCGTCNKSYEGKATRAHTNTNSSIQTLMKAQQVVQAALDSLMAGRTVLVVAHRLSTIPCADKIVVFRRGAVVEAGSHEELAAITDGAYAELLAAQSGA